MRDKMSFVKGASALIVLAVLSNVAGAQTLTTLFSFDGTNGRDPWNSLTLSGSTLYGMTGYGGSSGYGNIFSINTNGTGFQNLFSFNGTNGMYPTAELTLSGSTLYGMTNCGGSGVYGGYGNIFSIGTDGTGFQNLVHVRQHQRVGSHWQLDPERLNALWDDPLRRERLGQHFFDQHRCAGFQSLFSFDGTNGSDPLSDLTLSGSTLYGTVYHSRGQYDSIFSVKTDGGGFQNLSSFSFTGTPGYRDGSLTLSGSTLYGVTQMGGSGYGNIFSINTDGTGFQNLFSFDGTNGKYPYAYLTLSGSTLYGTTLAGGSQGCGNIFSINTNGTGFQNLFSFNGTDGTYPNGSLTLSGSTLYGMAEIGGASGYGTVFALTLPANLAWNQPGSGSWSNANNWDGNRVPGTTPQDTAKFGTVVGSNTASVTLDGNWTIGALTFSTTGGGSYTISRAAGDSTSTLTLTGTGTSFPLTNSGGNHTIAVPVVLGSSLSVSAVPGSSVTVSGPISETNPGTSVTLTGGGTLVLGGANTYSGSTAISAGTMKLAGAFANNIAASPTISVNSGATLDVTGLSGGGITLASGQTLAGNGAVAGGVVVANGSHVAPGIGTLTTSSLTLNSGSVLDYQFGSGSNGLIKVNTLGGLTMNGGGFNLYNQGSTTAFATPGTYKLVQYSGALGGVGTSALSVLNPLPGTKYAFSAPTGEVDLTIQPNPASRTYTCPASPLPPSPTLTDRLAEWIPTGPNSGSWQPVSPGSVTGNVHVLVHGWAPGELGWVNSNGGAAARIWNDNDIGPDGKPVFAAITNLAEAIDTTPGQTVLAYSWIDMSATAGNLDFSSWDLSKAMPYAAEAQLAAPAAGFILGAELRAAIGSNTDNLQLIGHSYGAKVATLATLQLVQWGIPVQQLTLLDSPELGSQGVLGSVSNRLQPYLAQLSVGSGPGQTFVDNYTSLVGTAYSGTGSLGNITNVSLAPPNPTDVVAAHNYPINWYATSGTAANPGQVGLGWSPLMPSHAQPPVGQQYTQDWKDNDELDLTSGTYVPPLQLTEQRRISGLTTLLQTDGVTGIPGGCDFTKHSPQYWDSTFTTDATDVAIQFNYQFLQPGDGDQLAVWVDNNIMFVATGDLTGTEQQLGSFDISGLAPGSHVMTFALENYGSAPAEFTVTNLQVDSVPEPSTFALLLTASLGLAGAALHRRRRGTGR